MKSSKILYRSLNLNKKTNIISIILLTLLLSCSLICCSIANYIPHTIEKQKMTNLNARLIYISPDDLTWDDDDLKFLSNNKHIELIFSQDEGYFYNQLETDKGSFQCRILGATGSMLPDKLIAGKSNILEDYEILIPSKITLSDGTILNGSELLDKYISITVEARVFTDSSGRNVDHTKSTFHTKEFKVVGVYDITEGVYFANQIFTTMETSRQLHQISNGNIYDYIEPPVDRVLVVDTYQNALTLVSQLNNSGYNAAIGFSFNYPLMYGIQALATVICIITVALCLFIVLFLLKKNLLKRKHDIALLKIIGYAHAELFKTLSVQTIIPIIISLTLSIIIYGKLFPQINNIIFSRMYFPVYSLDFLLGIFIFLFFTLGICIWNVSAQLKHINVIEILKGVNS